MMRHPRCLLLGSAAVIGVIPHLLGQIAPSSFHACVCVLAPAFLSSTTYRLTKEFSTRRQILWGLIGSFVATTILTAILAVIGWSAMGDPRVALGMVPAPFWFPWLVLATLPPLLIRHRWTNGPSHSSWIHMCLVVIASYALSAGVCFNPWSATGRADAEHPDARGRLPALGPDVLPTGRLVCPAQGPSFLFSADYSGEEWIWIVYRPIVLAWFALNRNRYYD